MDICSVCANRLSQSQQPFMKGSENELKKPEWKFMEAWSEEKIVEYLDLLCDLQIKEFKALILARWKLNNSV